MNLRTAPLARTGERLSKRIMALAQCSRTEAENYIEGGWVQVDGIAIEEPALRVQATQNVTLDAQAQLQDHAPVTLILHKPPGTLDGLNEPNGPDEPAAATVTGGGTKTAATANKGASRKSASPPPARQLLQAANHCANLHEPRLLQRHLRHLQAMVPLETGASGLLVFTQDWRCARKLQTDMTSMEHELMVEVQGQISDAALQCIGAALRRCDAPVSATRFSVSSSSPQHSQLRLAVKGAHPGLAEYLCQSADLTLLALRRIRLGRVQLGPLPVGQWRYLGYNEKF